MYQFSEGDLANDNFRASLNTALENGFFSTDKGMIQRSPNFYCVMDGNTCGRGAHPAFPSRVPFDAAFAARFFFIEFEYDWNLARSLVEAVNKDALPLIEWAKKASVWAIANQIPVVISPREILTLAELRLTSSMPIDSLFDGVMRGLDPISKEKLLSNHVLPAF